MKKELKFLLAVSMCSLVYLSGCGETTTSVENIDNDISEETYVESGESSVSDVSEQEDDVSEQEDDVSETEDLEINQFYLSWEKSTWFYGEEEYYEWTYDSNGNVLEAITNTQSIPGPDTYTYEYDENGNLTKLTHVYSLTDGGEGTEITTYEYEFDVAGNAIKVTEFRNGEKDLWHEYEYDDNGKIIKDSMYGSWGGYEIKEFDEHGEQILSVGTSGAGWPESRVEDKILYDDNGNIVVHETYENGEFWIHWECEYNTDGNVVKDTRYNDTNEIISWTENIYDEHGNITKSTDYNNSGEMTYLTVYEYDDHFKLIKKSLSDVDGSWQDITEYEYDDNGNCIKEITYDQDGSVRRTQEYEYKLLDE